MAAEGKNEVARNLLDLQPTAVLEFFQLQLKDPNTQKEEKFFFHGGSLFSDTIIWQENQYFPIAVETEGFEVLGDRRLPRPKLRVANKDFIVTALLQKYNDFINAKIIRKKAFVKNLDDANFDGGNPWGTANATAEISSETWIVGRKASESKLYVELELNSPLDLESFNVNDRAIVSKYCAWQYRGLGCRYAGLPVETEDEKPFVNPTGGTVLPVYRSPNGSSIDFWHSSDAEWNANKQYIAGDIIWISGNSTPMPPLDFVGNKPFSARSFNDQPYKTVYVCVSGNSGQFPNLNPTFWAKDGCSKNLGACRKRFNLENQFTYVFDEPDPTGFDTIKFSGNKSIFNGDSLTGSCAGLFYSIDPTIVGTLTGTFTIAGWVSGNNASSQLSAILSTTPRGENTGDNQDSSINDFFNLTRVNNGIPENQNDLQFSYLTRNTTPTEDAPAKVNYTLGQVDAGWQFFIISNEGPDTKIPDYIDESSPTRFQVQKRVNGPTVNYPFMKFRLSQNLTYRRANNKTPKHFMLGAIPVTLPDKDGTSHPVGYHATMNGEIGPWALWNRTLTEKEKDFLYKSVYTPEPDTIDFMPRNYYECTGTFTGVTGNNLVAWWDATTGIVDGGTTLGMLDIHTVGPYHLTGSGNFETGDVNIVHRNEIQVSNPSFFYPRFGGFPGTDGFGY